MSEASARKPSQFTLSALSLLCSFIFSFNPAIVYAIIYLSDEQEATVIMREMAVKAAHV